MADKPTRHEHSHSHYENNPFYIASKGITLLFNAAQGTAVFLVVLSVLGLFGNSISQGTANEDPNGFRNYFMSLSPSDLALLIGSILIVGLALAMISALFNGVASYTSAQIAAGNRVRLLEAFHEAFENLWSYLWLQIIIFVKLFLWTLLLIVPGIIMAVRYSLAGVAFYDEDKNLRGNDAIKESLRLTKGAWLTTFAASGLFNILTLGSISSLVSTGVNAVLYRQLDDAGDKKPDAHWLSWLTVILPFAVLSFIVSGILIVGIGSALVSGLAAL